MKEQFVDESIELVKKHGLNRCVLLLIVLMGWNNGRGIKQERHPLDVFLV
jgi:hypothetical protein